VPLPACQNRDVDFSRQLANCKIQQAKTAKSKIIRMAFHTRIVGLCESKIIAWEKGVIADLAQAIRWRATQYTPP